MVPPVPNQRNLAAALPRSLRQRIRIAGGRICGPIVLSFMQLIRTPVITVKSVHKDFIYYGKDDFRCSVLKYGVPVMDAVKRGS